MICSQPYITVNRKIGMNALEYVETESYLYLYKDKLVAENESFPLSTVLDISYRSMSNSYGFLYLHTNKGVYPYVVKASPAAFIAEYKKVKMNY